MSTTFNCSSCGAPIDYDGGPDPTIRCQFCNNVVIVPETLRTAAKEETQPAASSAATLGQTPQWHEIARLVRDGQKIEAIKLFRQMTGAGLKESKDAIEKLESGQTLEVANYAIVLEPKNVPPADIDRATQIQQIGALIKRGQKIEAIKLYRRIFGAGLKEAKDAIDKLETTVDTPGAFDILPPTITSARPTPRAAEVKGNPFILPLFILGVLGLIFGCYVVATLDEYDTYDISIIWNGTPTYTPAPTELPEPTFPPAPTRVPEPTLPPPSTPTPEFARPNILAACIGNGRRCFEEGRFVGIDGAGFIYAGETTGRIQVFDSDGEYQAEWRVADTDVNMESLAVDRQGIVYAVYNGTIHRFKGIPGGDPGAPLDPIPYEGGPGFQSIALAPDGGLVAAWNKDWQGGIFTNFTESQDDIVIFDSAGSVARVIPQALSVVAGGDAELQTVVGVDPQGNLYASGWVNQGLYKFTADGKFLDKFGGTELKGTFADSIVIDDQGRVYASVNGDTYIFDSTGNVLTFLDYGAYGLALTDEGNLLAMAQYELFLFTLLR